MIDFNVKCPKNYPLKCSLFDTEKEALVRSEKYKAFLMYKFDGQANYLMNTVNKYFHTPLYHVFDAREESGLGIKSCKICRLALASDFGIASLTPLNNNVFFEVGLMQGLGKPVVYLVDKDFKNNSEKGAKAVPFDLSDQLVIEHTTGDELLARFEKEIPSFIEKVQLSTIYEKDFIEFIKKKIDSFNSPESRKLLKFFVLEQSQGMRENWICQLIKSYDKTLDIGALKKSIRELIECGLIKEWYPQRVSGVALSGPFYCLEEQYRDILKQLLFKK